jgi:hypothetical protein
MGILKERFKAKADQLGAEVKDLLKEHGNKVIGEVQLSQITRHGGMTGLVRNLFADAGRIRFAAVLFPNWGKLPRVPGSSSHYQRLFYLMLIGELPTGEDVQHVAVLHAVAMCQIGIRLHRGIAVTAHHDPVCSGNVADQPVREVCHGINKKIIGSIDDSMD